MTRLVRPISLALAVALLTAITIYILSYLAFPVTGVQVENNRMLPETEVWSAVPDHASLLTLNPKLLGKKIKTNPWVKGVEVSKNWESGIVVVEVKERSPVLKGELNDREVVYSEDGVELPELGGAELEKVEAVGKGRLRGILSVIRSIEKSGSGVERITDVGPRGTTAVVEGRRVLLSDRVGEPQARALPELMRQNPEASAFDLRSPGRVVVGEAPGQETPSG